MFWVRKPEIVHFYVMSTVSICISSGDRKTFGEMKQILFILHKLPKIVICLTAANDIKLLKVK